MDKARSMYRREAKVKKKVRKGQFRKERGIILK